MTDPADSSFQQRQLKSTASQSVGTSGYSDAPPAEPLKASSSTQARPEAEAAAELPAGSEPPPADSGGGQQQPADAEDDDDEDDDQRDDEDEEEEEEDKIIERSHNERWAKRNNRLPRHAPGVTGSYLAIDQRVGKDVIWNEIILKEEQTGAPKLVLITERTEEGTLKQFMSNTTRSRAIWQRCMANLLSVLKFFLELGLTHGNLTSETIHYQQKSGNLKVGTMAMDDLLNPKANRDRSKFVTVKHYLAPEYADAACKITPAVDIYALGVIALELARKDDLIPNSEDRIEAMLRKDFIKGCLHTDPGQRHTWWHLYRHPAVFVVPKLDVFAARAYIGHLPPNLDHKAMREQLDQMLERFENDTVMVEMRRAGQTLRTASTPIFGFGDRDEVHMLDGKPHLKRPKDPARTLSDAVYCRCSEASDYTSLASATTAASSGQGGVDSVAGGFEVSGGCV
uniref:Protein kinase domain-containing protein n=1 Tax=Macrostomum lignano TaxID=282301 RepID=A0A1I8H6M3_9PLAT